MKQGGQEAKADPLVGKIEYELIEVNKQRIISKGTLLIHRSDIAVSSIPLGGLKKKEFPVHEQFHLGFSSPKAKLEDLSGFGLTLENREFFSFSWDWLQVIGRGKAKKFQGEGMLEFTLAHDDDLVEVDKIFFASDTDLRCYIRPSTVPDAPDWIAKIKKGSYIYWISGPLENP